MLHPHLGTQLLAFVLLIALLLLARRHLRRLRDPADQVIRELREEIHRRMPVFSTETTRGTEAEFIRDRLPKRFPFALVATLLVLFIAAAWWLNR